MRCVPHWALVGPKIGIAWVSMCLQSMQRSTYKESRHCGKAPHLLWTRPVSRLSSHGKCWYSTAIGIYVYVNFCMHMWRVLTLQKCFGLLNFRNQTQSSSQKTSHTSVLMGEALPMCFVCHLASIQAQSSRPSHAFCRCSMCSRSGVDVLLNPSSQYVYSCPVF